MMQVYVGIHGCQSDLFTPEASGGVKGCKALQSATDHAQEVCANRNSEMAL